MRHNVKKGKMKNLIVPIMALIFISCIGHENSENSNAYEVTLSNKDTLLYYCQPDYTIYSFDTIAIQAHYEMKTYCLNDSSVYNETFTEKRSENSNLIEYSVAHNYATDLNIRTDGKEIKIRILKENFKDSLPTNFFNICHMWKNEFSHFENDSAIFRATLAQPDTDYQFAVLYIITNKGEIRIIKVEDESYDGSDDE